MKIFFKRTFVLAAGVISVLYLLNPTAGIFELIPDNIPFLGNLDEFTAAALLLDCLAYFGLNLRLFARSGRNATVSHSITAKVKDEV
jgi:hypothetical protein